MHKKKGQTIEIFRENTNNVFPPWGEEIVPRKKRIRIKRLAHTTHEASYKSIRKKTPFNCFKFNKVCGKEKRSPKAKCDCYTYKQPLGAKKFQLVPPDDQLLPGYYSWWEVDFEDDTRQKLITEIIEEFGSTRTETKTSPLDQRTLPQLLKIAHKEKLNLPTYIQGKGYHGPHKFSANLGTLLQRYKEARDGMMVEEETRDGGSQVIFRFAGTLRYKYQVSSVVLVCCDCDYELERYKTLNHVRRFHMQKLPECADLAEQYLDFYSDSITIMSSKDYSRSFWHQAVFAFYSPTEEMVLRLEESKDGEWKDVWHPICATYGPHCKKIAATSTTAKN